MGLHGPTPNTVQAQSKRQDINTAEMKKAMPAML